MADLATSLVALILCAGWFAGLDALIGKWGASYRRLRALGLALAGGLAFWFGLSGGRDTEGTLFTVLLSVGAGILCAIFGLSLAAQRSESRLARWCRRLLDWRGDHRL